MRGSTARFLKLWKRAQGRIKEKVGDKIHGLLFRPLQLVGYENGRAVVEAPNGFIKGWIEDNYGCMLGEVLGEVLGESIVRCEISIRRDGRRPHRGKD